MPVMEARLEHLQQVAELYRPYVLHTHHTFETEPPDLATWQAAFEEHVVEGPHHLFVALEDDQVVGYAQTRPFHSRPGYATSCTTSIFVRQGHAGRGIGAQLYTTLLARLDQQGAFHRAYAGIALPNPASVRLHERFGFQRAGLFREVGRKLGAWCDVAWYERPTGR